MATDFTEENAADAVIESFADRPDERLRTVLTSLVRHLHGFVRDAAGKLDRIGAPQARVIRDALHR